MARKIGLNGLDGNAQKAVNFADGSSPTDLVTLQQVQAAIRGIDWKESVRAATTANIALNAAQTIDGVSVIAGDRVLVKNQTDATKNGIYIAATGAWSRSSDANTSAQVTPGMSVTVEEGTTNGDKIYQLTTNGPIVLDTTALTFSQLGGGVAYTGGNGISIAGTVISALAGAGIVVDGSGIRADLTVLGRKSFSQAIGNGTLTTITVTHNLGTRDVHVTLYNATSPYEEMDTDVEHTDASTVTLKFAVAPTTGQYRVVIGD